MCRTDRNSGLVQCVWASREPEGADGECKESVGHLCVELAGTWLSGLTHSCAHSEIVSSVHMCVHMCVCVCVRVYFFFFCHASTESSFFSHICFPTCDLFLPHRFCCMKSSPSCYKKIRKSNPIFMYTLCLSKRWCIVLNVMTLSIFFRLSVEYPQWTDKIL